jgi:hypothetical protein
MWGMTLIRPPAEMVACRLILRSASRRSAVDARRGESPFGDKLHLCRDANGLSA